MKYNILDLETTGFSPQRGDRIVELSIISVDRFGNELKVFDTLVNPQRDLGATNIHGISASMVVNAPTFSDIAPDVLEMLLGGVIVAHNASFDLRFLKYEFKRLGLDVDWMKALCTLNLSKKIIPNLPARRLDVLCNYLDVPQKNAHAAYYDCQATTGVLMKLQNQYTEQYSFQDFVDTFYAPNLISPSRSNDPTNIEFLNEQNKSAYSPYHRSNALEDLTSKQSRLGSMLQRLPSTHQELELPVQEYLNLLDKILEDRKITEEEAKDLFLLASDYNLTKQQAKEIHEEYLRRLVRVYLLDGIITAAEDKDLQMVAKLLGIPNQLSLIINLEKANISLSQSIPNSSSASDHVGKTVCFTGTLISKLQGCLIDRNLAQQLAIEKGLVVKKGVTKDLDMLVVADPHTQSGKAKKARNYGTTILAEPVFWQMIGISVE